MRTEYNGHDDVVDALLAAARVAAPAPEGDFMARMLQDALAAQPQPQVPVRVIVRRRSVWRRLLGALGGGLGLAGIGSAAMAGLVIGYVQPDPLLVLTDEFGMTTAASVDLLPDFDGFLTEDFSQ